jgi:hypothetical protein
MITPVKRLLPVPFFKKIYYLCRHKHEANDHAGKKPKHIKTT